MSAKQKGLLPLQGTVGEVTFYKAADGSYRIRRRSAHARDSILHGANFARTREHLAEFKAAILAGKLIGNALAPVSRIARDPDMRNRLTSRLFQIIKSDPVNPRGVRNVMDGNTGLLQDFALGSRFLSPSVFPVHWSTRWDRATGVASVDLPSFFPNRVLNKSKFATHFQLHSAVAELQFSTGFYRLDHRATGQIPIGKWMVPAQSMETFFTKGSTNLLLLVFGIAFYQYTNGVFYPLKNCEQNAMQIVAVSKEEGVALRRLQQVAPADETSEQLPAPETIPVYSACCSPAVFSWHRFGSGEGAPVKGFPNRNNQVENPCVLFVAKSTNGSPDAGCAT